jgi:hypothetical protein
MTNNCLESTPQPEEIIQGGDKLLQIKLWDVANKKPYDLTSATEVVAILPITASPTYLEKRLSLSQVTVDSAVLGEATIILGPSDTSSLTPGANISFEVRITIAGKVQPVQFLQALNVVPSLFPTAT